MAYSSGRVILFTMLLLHYTDSAFYFTSLLARQKAVGIHGVSSILHSALGWGRILSPWHGVRRRFGSTLVTMEG
jgi:hypothetical protein